MEKEYEIPKSRVSKETRIAAGIFAISVACTMIYLLQNSLTITGLLFTTLSPILIYSHITSRAADANEAERRYKLTLTPEGIRYRWPGNESHLLFNDVLNVTVKGARHTPKSITFKMKNGVLHKIAKYDGMEEILLHAEAKLPFSHFRYNY